MGKLRTWKHNDFWMFMCRSKHGGSKLHTLHRKLLTGKPRKEFDNAEIQKFFVSRCFPSAGGMLQNLSNCLKEMVVTAANTCTSSNIHIWASTVLSNQVCRVQKPQFYNKKKEHYIWSNFTKVYGTIRMCKLLFVCSKSYIKSAGTAQYGAFEVRIFICSLHSSTAGPNLLYTCRLRCFIWGTCVSCSTRNFRLFEGLKLGAVQIDF